MNIPLPPQELLHSFDSVFAPDHAMPAFIEDTFLNPDSELYNEDHQHLAQASFGILWTNVENVSKQRRVLATVEDGSPKGKPWGKQKKEVQIEGWFGEIPTFIITIDARNFMECSNNQRCAILEHELYHCRQATDEFGAPKFNQTTGLPVFAIVGHDIEEFAGVVRRYGAYSVDLQVFKEALNEEPELPIESIDGICGTCMKQVA